MTRINILAVLFIFLTVSLSTAAQAPRGTPANNDLAAARIVHLPFGHTVNDIDDATIQSGEPVLPCLGATGASSVWYYLRLPVGLTLVVDTTGSTYDTAVAVWTSSKSANPTFADLTNVDCEDDGTAPALLKYETMAAGGYYVSIVSTSALATSVSLTVDFSVDVPDELLPGGGSLGDAVPLKFNRPTTLKNLEYGILHDPIVEGPSCASAKTAYPAWFKLTMPFAGDVSFDTEGSVLFYTSGTYIVDTTIALFPETFVESDDDIACNDVGAFGSVAALSPVSLAAGVYYVRVTSINQTLNAGFASRYRVTTRLTGTANLMTNPGFESPAALDGWKVKRGTGDAPTTVEPIAGTTSFLFSGGPNERSKLIQHVEFDPVLPVDDSVSMIVTWISKHTIAGQSAVLGVNIDYKDGKRQKERVTFVTDTIGQATPRQISVEFDRLKPIRRISVFVKFKGTSGSMLVDAFSLQLRSYYARSEGAGPMPLPPAPGG